MTTVLAIDLQLHDSLDLSGPDHDAAQAVASGLRGAKADNTRRAYASSWRRFKEWAEAGDQQTLPATPQTVALYLGRLAADGKSMASIEQTRAAISHFHAAAGFQKTDAPARHPVVAEAVKGWRNRASAPKRAEALITDALNRVREVLRVPRRGRGGWLESADTAHKRAALDLAIIGVLADGGLRCSEAAALIWADVELWADGTGRITAQKGKNQPEPEMVAVTAATARASGKSGPREMPPPLRCSGLPARPWLTGCAPRQKPPAWATG